MDQSIKNLLTGVREWVNGKLEDMSLVIAGHINELYSRVNGKQETLTAGDNISIDSGNTISVIGMPENISDLTNDSGFVTIEDVIDDSESSSGKTYSSTKINELISNLNQFNVVVVNELPSAGTSHTLYFVPQSGASGSDVMDEYMWIENTWELVGTTRIDLSQYYTVAETNALLDEKQGVLTAGANVTIDSGNTISVDVATENTLGVVKVGSGLAIDNAGTISLEEITVAEVLAELNAEDEEEEVGA